jgi:hypothetical protein
MIEINTVDQIIELKPQLEDFYLPCKCKIYLEDLTEKKCITILRQFIKTHNYKLISFEKSLKGKKIMTYRLIQLNEDFLTNEIKEEPIKERKYIVSFN